MRTIGRPGKEHMYPVFAQSYRGALCEGALCEGSMRIKLRSELYAKGALCGSTLHLYWIHWSFGRDIGIVFFSVGRHKLVLKIHSLEMSYLHMRSDMTKPVLAICEQQRRRSACASALSDQHLYCSLPV